MVPRWMNESAKPFWVRKERTLLPKAPNCFHVETFDEFGRDFG